jgi:acyl-CoA thioester hydrolase
VLLASADGWDLPAVHRYSLEVAEREIDGYGHVNNAVYVEWVDRAAWDHSTRLGISIDRCQTLDRGMAVVRSVLVYRRAALLHDRISIGTWLLPGGSRMRVRRRFQVRRDTDGETLLRAEIDYACIELSTGRPARWPTEFSASYAVLPEVAAAERTLEPL